MKELKLKAKLRQGTGKGFAKKLRRNGEIPCVIYGHGEQAISASVWEKDFQDLMKRNPYDPITDEVLHIDFQHLHKGEKITVDIPIKASGIPIGEKEGGMLEQVTHEVRVTVLPSKISSVITVDVSQLTTGKSIHIKDIDIGDAELADNPERTVFHVVIPRVVEEVVPVVEEITEVEEEEVEAEEKEERVEKEEKQEGKE